MRDLAEHLGVSRQLVSIALRGVPGASDETRARVQAAAAELGYHPDASARLLRGRRSYQIGVVFTMHQPFEIDLVEALLGKAAEEGFTLVLGPLTPGRSHAEVIQDLLGHRIEALVVLAADQGASSLSDLPTRIPVVQLGGPISARPVDDVRVDNEVGIHLIMGHLFQLGHERITHISGGQGPNAQSRLTAYESEMTAAGLASTIDVVGSDYTEEAGAAAAQTLLSRTELPTALVCANDRCAVGVLETLVRNRVSIPGDVSIAGFDDSSIASLPFIQLTTVRHDPTSLAAAAIAALVRRIANPHAAVTAHRQIPDLVIRQSTGRPRPSN